MTATAIELRVDGLVATVAAAHARLVAPLVTTPGHEFVDDDGRVVGRARAEVLGRAGGGCSRSRRSSSGR